MRVGLRLGALAAFAALAVACAACGEGSAPGDDGASEPATGASTTTALESLSDSPSVAQVVDSVTVSLDTYTMVVGEALPVSGDAVDANGHAIAEAEFAWTSSDTSVVRVDRSGLVVAVAPGEAEITAASAGVTGRAALTVVAPVPTAVAVTPEVVALAALGQTKQLVASVKHQAGRVMGAADVSWSSTDTAVATVDSAGLVTAVSNGAATVTATAGTVSESVTVSVAQTVSSITVLPAAVELSGLGATAQLTAEMFDANGNVVVGVELSWESSDVAVLTVNTGGLVTTAGAGTATITATAGAASNAATVTAAGFTLSGTVSDARIEGLALAGAIARLSNGTRDSVTTDADGQYRFSNVLGQVEVAVTAVPGYLEQTAQVTVDADNRTLDFVLEHTGEPPYSGTVWVTPDILGPSDPTSLGSVTYAGRGVRDVYDRRVNMFVTVDAYLFEAQFGEQTVEFKVNPELGSQQAAREQVDRFAPAIGQLPAVLLSAVRQVDVNAGEGLPGGSAYSGTLLIHTDDDAVHLAVREGFLEEVFLHEAAHAAFDSKWDDPGWRSAQRADGVFISEYARDFPDHEDIAESFWAYFALRQRPDRLTTEERWFMMTTIPNRLAYFDEQQYDMSTAPLSDTESEILGTTRQSE